MKTKILIILIVLVGLGIGGFFVYKNISVPEEEAPEEETCGGMTLTEAMEIAIGSECDDRLKDTYMCNEDTGTWWIDLDIEKEGCNPACVINVETKTAVINWRCTGVILEPEAKGKEKVFEEVPKEKSDCPFECCLDEQYKTKICPAGYECKVNKCVEIEKRPVRIHDQNISGEIKQDQVWSGMIHVTGDIEVEEGVTLKIESGTVVKVAAQSDDQHAGWDHPHDPPFPKDPDRLETQSTKIIVTGTINAIGTPDNRIIFTSDSEAPTTYDWDGLDISHGKLEYVIVEYARYTNLQQSSDVVIVNSIFRNSLECCICIGHSKPISPQILYNDIYNCGHEGIDNAGGSPLIKGNRFHRENPEIQPDPSIGGVGYVVYKNAYPIIEDNLFEKNSNAIYFNSNSLHEEEPGKKVMVKNNTIKNNDVGFSIDPDYPFDVVIMENNQLINNKQDEAYTE